MSRGPFLIYNNLAYRRGPSLSRFETKKMSGYQHLQKYKGSLYGNMNYSGIEYDYELPDNVVVSSPGGVSGIHHHYTKGMYSDASSTKDIYAGNPKADAYPYGEYGNMYQTGQSATRFMGDYMEPADLNGRTGYTQNQGQPRTENFSNVELIDPEKLLTKSPGHSGRDVVDADPIGVTPITEDGVPKHKASILDVLKLLGLAVAAYMAVNFWVKSGENYITTRFFNGKDMDWKDYMIIAILFTFVVVISAYVIGVPLITLERGI